MIYQLERFPLNKLSVSMGIPEFLDSGRKCWTLVSGRWTLDSGLLTLDATSWRLGSGHWTLLLTVLKQNQNQVSDSA